MATYNGHRSWAFWNVSLWISNEEGLYRMALEHIRLAKTKDQAARNIVAHLIDLGITKTPDGANFTVSAVRAAITRLI